MGEKWLVFVNFNDILCLLHKKKLISFVFNNFWKITKLGWKAIKRIFSFNQNSSSLRKNAFNQILKLESWNFSTLMFCYWMQPVQWSVHIEYWPSNMMLNFLTSSVKNNQSCASMRVTRSCSIRFNNLLFWLI